MFPMEGPEFMAALAAAYKGAQLRNCLCPFSKLQGCHIFDSWPSCAISQ